MQRSIEVIREQMGRARKFGERLASANKDLPLISTSLPVESATAIEFELINMHVCLAGGRLINLQRIASNEAQKLYYKSQGRINKLLSDAKLDQYLETALNKDATRVELKAKEGFRFEMTDVRETEQGGHVVRRDFKVYRIHQD